MMRTSRARKFAPLAMLGAFLSVAGCMSTGDGVVPAGVTSPTTQARGVPPGYPQPMPPAPGQTLQTRYAQPAPGASEEGMVVEQGPPGPLPIPTELNPTAHPPHRVAAPDILYIEALRLVPKGPYKLEPMEVLQIEVSDTLPRQDIKGMYMISPEGFINLGFSYRSVYVAGLTITQAQDAIRNHLLLQLKNPTVNVTLVQMRGMQNIKGEHLVRPDGTISLGMYGAVYVAGMNLGQVKCTIENHLAAYLVNPQISVDVFAYNSRKIYIIADGAGYGQQVVALPCTGNETVLDAISRVQGLPAVASLKKIWVSRPAPAGHPCSQVLPVDWKAITQAGQTTTNWQLLPGDRIYVSCDPWICTYNWLDKILSPFDRVMSSLLLGATTYQTFQGNGFFFP